jgi:hypothetical protein
VEFLAWLIPVITLLLGYTLRGVEQRRQRIQAWDSAKREVYARYLIALEDKWNASRSLRIHRTIMAEKSEELSKIEMEALTADFRDEVSAMKQRLANADEELDRLQAEMEILSPLMVRAIGQSAKFSATDWSEHTGNEPEADKYLESRRLFVRAARRDLELESKTRVTGKPLFTVYWAGPFPTLRSGGDESHSDEEE